MDAKRWIGLATTIVLLGGAIIGGAFLGRRSTALGQTPSVIDTDPTIRDDYTPSRVETATFALGCFWGPDAMFGSLPGVLRTRVGYAGGTTSNPTYYDVADHAEAVEVDFDPNVITYRHLLDVFWSGHDPYQPPYSSQYRSIIFARDEGQREEATRFLAVQAEASGRTPWTTITRYVSFTRAEACHQKHDLWMARSVMNELLPGFDRFDEFVDSTLIARVNGFLAGWGSLERAHAVSGRLSLSETSSTRILEAVKAGLQTTCGLLVDPSLQEAEISGHASSEDGDASLGAGRLGP